MELSSVYDVKKTMKLSKECPICKQKVYFGVETHVLKEITEFPFTHVVLHGNPLHAMIVYIDANFAVRSIEYSKSIEVARDSASFSELLKKWSNPF
jgi:hypothetical protein